MALTERQQDVMRWLHEAAAPAIALLQGDVRSGKTWVAALSLLTHSLTRAGEHYIVLGQARSSLERSVLPALKSLAELFGLGFSWDYRKQAYLIGRNWFVPAGAGTDVVGAVLMGMSAAGAIIDEATLLSREVIDYVLSRIDRPGARILVTFNPVHPQHWLRQDWLLGGALPHAFFPFVLDDVVDIGVIAPEVRDRLEGTLSGFRKKRWLGNADPDAAWAGAAGLCYPSLLEAEAVGPPYLAVECGADYGLAHPTAGIFFGLAEDRNWETVGEYYSAEPGLTSADHADRLIELGEDLGCATFVADPSALTLKRDLQQRGARVVNADNRVAIGIDTFEGALASGRVRVTAAAPNLLREGASYSWDEKAIEDRPVKANDDACDGGRYWAMHRFPPRSLAGVHDKPRGL